MAFIEMVRWKGQEVLLSMAYPIYLSPFYVFSARFYPVFSLYGMGVVFVGALDNQSN